MSIIALKRRAQVPERVPSDPFVPTTLEVMGMSLAAGLCLALFATPIMIVGGIMGWLFGW